MFVQCFSSFARMKRRFFTLTVNKRPVKNLYFGLQVPLRNDAWERYLMIQYFVRYSIGVIAKIIGRQNIVSFSSSFLTFPDSIMGCVVMNASVVFYKRCRSYSTNLRDIKKNRRKQKERNVISQLTFKQANIHWYFKAAVLLRQSQTSFKPRFHALP